MNGKKLTKLLITIFFGFLGVHKFMERNYKMGFIYLLTMGLCGIGWIIDIFKVAFENDDVTSNIMPKEVIKQIKNGEIPKINISNLILKEDEFCCYVDNAETYRDKTITTGYTRKGAGVSVRVGKGLSYHTGGGGSQAIRETQRTTYSGILYLTNKRVIFTSQKDSFDKDINKLTSVTETKNGLVIQIGSDMYEIITKSHSLFMSVFNNVRNQ